MEQTFKEEAKGGSLICRIAGDGVCVVSCRAQEQRLEIPDRIRGLAVTEIGKKAFLGDKTLREAALPETVSQIGDWAFASCSRLEKIRIPRKEIRLGRGIFKGCTRLSQIFLQERRTGSFPRCFPG